MSGTTGSTRTEPTPDAPDVPADVLVVGAGPTGLLLAGDLAAAGLRVTLVERRPPGTTALTRAFAVHARTLELLDARGLADELIATGTRVTRLLFFRRLPLELSRLPSRFPFVLLTPQYEVERLLERRARSAGVSFLYDTRLTGLTQSAGEVVAEVTSGGTTSDQKGDEADGEESGRGSLEKARTTTLRAQYLVGADGVRSATRRLLGLPFPGGSVIRSMILADVRLAEAPAETPVVDGAGDSFAFIASFGDGWYRVMGWRRTHQAAEGEPVGLEELREITVRALGSDHGMHDARWISRFHSDERQVPSYRSGRVFLAGDAAHVHSPAGGMGMNTGLQDAANLSWKLVSALKGRTPAPEALLDGYHAERHPVGAAAVRSSGGLLRLAMADTPAQRTLRSLFSVVLRRVPPAASRAIGRVSGVGIRYRRPLGAHPLTGSRAPDLALAEGRLYELLRKGEFVLVTPAGAARPPAAPAPEGTVEAHWSSDRQEALLIRPDGYIAWASGARGVRSAGRPVPSR